MISDRLQILIAQFDDWSQDAVNQRVSTYRRLMAVYDIALSSAFFLRETHEAAPAEASEVLKELMMDPEVRSQLSDEISILIDLALKCALDCPDPVTEAEVSLATRSALEIHRKVVIRAQRHQ